MDAWMHGGMETPVKHACGLFGNQHGLLGTSSSSSSSAGRATLAWLAGSHGRRFEATESWRGN